MMLLGFRTRLKLAGGQGLEPRYLAPKANVLPLDDPPILRPIAVYVFCPTNLISASSSGNCVIVA